MHSTLPILLTLAAELVCVQKQPQDMNRFATIPRMLTQLDRQSLDQRFRESTRRCRAWLESEIESYEEYLEEFPLNHVRYPSLYTQELANRRRSHLDYLRGWHKHELRMEQVLDWYQKESKINPGPETEQEYIDRLDQAFEAHEAWLKAWRRGLIAPPPREVKKQPAIPRMQ